MLNSKPTTKKPASCRAGSFLLCFFFLLSPYFLKDKGLFGASVGLSALCVHPEVLNHVVTTQPTSLLFITKQFK